MTTRRGFLVSASAAALVAAVPLPSLLAAPAAVAAPAPTGLAFIVGTPGEYDWQHIVAKTAEEAWRIWVSDHDYHFDSAEEAAAAPFDPDHVTRVEGWDGLAPGSTSSGDWLDAGFGHICDRCGDETSPDCGARNVEGLAVCECCLTWHDRLACGDHDEIVDEIANQLASGDDEQEVRAWLERQKLLPAVDDLGLWAKGVEASS